MTRCFTALICNGSEIIESFTKSSYAMAKKAAENYAQTKGLNNVDISCEETTDKYIDNNKWEK